MNHKRSVDLRGTRPYPEHTHQFELPISPSTVADQRNPDKQKLKETILALRAQGWSYRQIGREVGLHWTRVGQILKDVERKRLSTNANELE
jgi:hypothetical protein